MSRRPFIVRLFTLPPSAIERSARRRAGPLIRWLVAVVPALFVLVLVSALTMTAMRAWSRLTNELTPRHRPEALCFALDRAPRFEPPMRVEPSAAVLHSQFVESTPPAVALQQTMGFSNDMVLRASSRQVGDFDVAVLWLRIPEDGRANHWLIACWLEDSNLAVCNFRFESSGTALTDEQTRWGDRLLDRILQPQMFRAGAIPAVRFRPRDGATMPSFGPPSG